MTAPPETIQTPYAGFLICLIALSLSAGCGPGSGQGLDENGNLITLPGDDSGDPGPGPGGGASGNPNATLTWLQSNVFGGVCTQCHTGAGAPMGVDWSSESASCENVGRSSGEMPTLLEVESGNADASYVIWKVEGAGPNGEAIVGAQMPLSNPPLSAETIQNMRDWVGDGTPGCQTQQLPGQVSVAASKISAASATLAEPIDPSGSWMLVWQEALQICATCHSLAPSNPRCQADLQCPPHGVVLNADNYYGVVDGHTVAPFDPDGSSLWRRISSDDPHQRMPFGLAPLNGTQLNNIREWIERGAPLCAEGEDCR